MARLSDELKMSRPFARAEEEATLAICRTADILQQRIVEVLRQVDITPAQYNVLRILHKSPNGLACKQIADRLITHDPDVTRLLDRMETRHWIKRKRSKDDRRVVFTCITSSGSKLLQDVRPLISALHTQQYQGWGEPQLQQLIELLDRVRELKPDFQKENNAYLPN
ncbi:MAG: MarR family transcriptional regulator [Acidobacteriota bacterium]|nr:MarR family transcriptional regulator [Acidobacteriota bacterium]